MVPRYLVEEAVTLEWLADPVKGPLPKLNINVHLHGPMPFGMQFAMPRSGPQGRDFVLSHGVLLLERVSQNNMQYHYWRVQNGQTGMEALMRELVWQKPATPERRLVLPETGLVDTKGVFIEKLFL
jgi:hypothetical protein